MAAAQTNATYDLQNGTAAMTARIRALADLIGDNAGNEDAVEPLALAIKHFAEQIDADVDTYCQDASARIA